MSSAQHAAFQQLLSGWRHHQDLRNSGGSIDQLSESRRVLDEYRLLAATAR